jgi:hypothetical protein
MGKMTLVYLNRILGGLSSQYKCLLLWLPLVIIPFTGSNSDCLIRSSILYLAAKERNLIWEPRENKRFKGAYMVSKPTRAPRP